jgi:hypothetical protein
MTVPRVILTASRELYARGCKQWVLDTNKQIVRCLSRVVTRGKLLQERHLIGRRFLTMAADVGKKAAAYLAVDEVIQVYIF